MSPWAVTLALEITALSNYRKLPWLFALVTHAGGRLKEGWHAAAISWRHCYAWVMNRLFLFLTFQQWQSHHSQDRGLQRQGHPGECRLCLSSDDRQFFYVSFPSLSKPLVASHPVQI